MTPSRTIMTGALGLLTAMGLVAVGGTAAATNGNWAAVSLAAGPSSGASASNSPGAPPPGNGVFFASCRLARLAGAAPIERDEPGYRRGLDRDLDGVACERDSNGDGRDDNDDDDGSDGRDGRDGSDGDDGKDGKDGSDGDNGSNGSTGRTGQIVGSYDVDLDPPARNDGFSQIGSDDIPFGSVATG
jgi:hypothetical protein